jgi:hypothetical protein
MSTITECLDKAAAGIETKRERVAKRKAEADLDQTEREAADDRIAKRAAQMRKLRTKLAELAAESDADLAVIDQIELRVRQRTADDESDFEIACELESNCTAARVERRSIGLRDIGTPITEFHTE